MRKLIVLSFITLDGVMQAPGGTEEDSSGEFEYGGWVAPFTDEIFSSIMQKQMQPADMLLGRKTFEIFAGYWPLHTNGWPAVNEVTKYVLSNTIGKSEWQNSVFIKTIEDIKKLKSMPDGKYGSDIKVWGSSQLIQLLLEHDLVDELWLKIFPLTLGRGKKLFSNGTIPAAFTLTDSITTTSGVIVANFKRAGEVKTGNIGA